MSKIALLLGVCLTLSACVLYTPTYVTNTQNTVIHRESTSSLTMRTEQKTTEVSERAKPKVIHKGGQHTLADCGAFIPPRDARKPTYLSDAEMATAKDLPDLDRMIGLKMKELQTYIDKLPSKYEQAHRVWMESCANKLLN